MNHFTEITDSYELTDSDEIANTYDSYKDIFYENDEMEEHIVDHNIFLKYEDVVKEFRDNTLYHPDFKYQLIYIDVLEAIRLYNQSFLKYVDRTHYWKSFKNLFGF